REARPPGSSGRERRGDLRQQTRSGLRTLEVGDEARAVGAGDDLDELPAVGAEVVEDLLRVVNEQRCGQVLPLRHGPHPTDRPAQARWRWHDVRMTPLYSDPHSRDVLDRAAIPPERTVSYGDDAAQVYDVREP